MKALPLFPVYSVDFVGSFLMLLLSFTTFRYALQLKRENPESVFFMYLFGLSTAFVAFSISRSIGHMLRFVFVYAGVTEWWRALAPISGSLNSICFVVVAVLSFVYPNVGQIIALVRADAERLKRAKEELEAANRELRELHQTLEEKVRKRTQELLASEQKFRRLFENSGEVIFFCDAEGRISDINPSGVKLLGYQSKEELIGKPMWTFFAEDEDWQKYLVATCKIGFIKDFETRWITKGGGERYVIITANAIEGESGCKIGCEGIAKDITNYRKMTEKLIYSEKMASLGQLAAGVAHEINTPLGIILGYAQMLKKDFKDQPEVAEELEIIESQAEVCKKIVADLLSFARSSNVSRLKKPLCINDCIVQTVDMVRHTFELDRIEIKLYLTPDLPEILGNEDQLRQVFVNLLNNSRDAIEKDGEIHIWTFAEKDYVFVEIGDTGSGIPPDIKDKIFDPFFTTKAPRKGTGLGLSVSYGIIEDHEGKIEVFSPPKEEKHLSYKLNTVFVIKLPIYRGESNESAHFSG
ncbi:two-component system sensor histidine kinase NtrB [Thermodesulfatator atlanticus]|uniref:two-component system sensor histidine kinase NtrB n=1 Tax=Thermodesulfatator atlanticus TaxID=501497 RepID=UPI0003B78BD2|nr:ATP-binding protein [Thermodesulfatator atlanticus]